MLRTAKNTEQFYFRQAREDNVYGTRQQAKESRVVNVDISFRSLVQQILPAFRRGIGELEELPDGGGGLVFVVA